MQEDLADGRRKASFNIDYRARFDRRSDTRFPRSPSPRNSRCIFIKTQASCRHPVGCENKCLNR